MKPPLAPSGRGAKSQPAARYLQTVREDFDDGWPADLEAPPSIATTLTWEQAKSLINANQSPDIPFELSINPYRGCEHGCIYCYARPAHAFVDLSPGLDFESKLFAKANAAAILRRELAAPGYRCRSIALGANTDAYQPVERKLRVTRDILAVLAETLHPLTIVTKSALVERDLDLLAPMAAKGLVQVFLSITTLDSTLARRLEPRAAAPVRRLRAISTLAAAGVPCGVMFAPVIPALNEHEMEAVLSAAAAAGARYAGYVLLRLPREVSPLFREWLQVNYPLKATRVMARVHELRGGRDNDPNFGSRLTGTGVFAELMKSRFAKACREHQLQRSDHHLNTTHFRPPRDRVQGDFFD